METKHTNGKWINNGLEIRHAERSIILANVYDHLEANQPRKEAEANAKLIAAAPELLAALKYCLQRIDESDEWWMDSPNRGGFDTEIIESAIKKATE